MNDIIRELLLRTNTPHNLTLAYSKQKNAIVERVNKEVNRHLRAFAFHSANLEAYKLCLPFVQRIINSSVHSSTGASPASLLFRNQLNLDRYFGQGSRPNATTDSFVEDYIRRAAYSRATQQYSNK